MRAFHGPFLAAALLTCGPVSAGIDLITAPVEATAPIDLDIGDYTPSSETVIRSEDPEKTALLHECDVKAAHPANPDNPPGVKGVVYGDLDGPRALAACLKALEAAPDDLRIRYQLARAKQASGQGRGAIADLRALADLDYVPAINNLGATYQIGIGVPRDYQKALFWYEKASEMGFAPSMAVVAWLYHRGLGTDADAGQAMKWYRKAAEGGSASAMHNIGHLYLSGQSVEADPVEATRWFRKSANNGFAQGMTMVGWSYQVGSGVSVNGKRAIEWYEKAAEAGEVGAMASLGALFDSGGSGVRTQPRKSAEWLLKAIGEGHEATRARLVDNPESLSRATRRAVQARLARMGFDPGPADGVFGTGTRAALDQAFKAQ